MATQPHTTRARAWATAIANHTNLNQKLGEARPQERDPLERAIAAQQDELLNLPAPDWAAVIQKLQIMWEGGLHGLDQTSDEQRMILEDLGYLLTQSPQPRP